MSRTDPEAVVFTHDDGRTQGAYVGSQMAETLAADPAWELGEAKASAASSEPSLGDLKAKAKELDIEVPASAKSKKAVQALIDEYETKAAAAKAAADAEGDTLS